MGKCRRFLSRSKMALQDKVEAAGGFLALLTLLVLLILHSVAPGIQVPLHHIGILLSLIAALLGLDIAKEHRRIMGALGSYSEPTEDENE